MAILIPSELRQKFDDYIKTNGSNDITGVVLNDIMHDIFDSMENINELSKAWAYNGSVLEPNPANFPKSGMVKLNHLAKSSGLTSYPLRTLAVDKDGKITALENKLDFNDIGTVALPANFPSPEEVEYGDIYDVTDDVTDNDPEKTNTGQSFTEGDKIFWNNEYWEKYDNLKFQIGKFVTAGDEGDYPTIYQAIQAGYLAIEVISDITEDGKWDAEILEIRALPKASGEFFKVNVGDYVLTEKYYCLYRFQNIELVFNEPESTVFDSIQGYIYCDDVILSFNTKSNISLNAINNKFSGRKLTINNPGKLINCYIGDLEVLNLDGTTYTLTESDVSCGSVRGYVKRITLTGNFKPFSYDPPNTETTSILNIQSGSVIEQIVDNSNKEGAFILDINCQINKANTGIIYIKGSNIILNKTIANYVYIYSSAIVELNGCNIADLIIYNSSEITLKNNTISNNYEENAVAASYERFKEVKGNSFPSGFNNITGSKCEYVKNSFVSVDIVGTKIFFEKNTGTLIESFGNYNYIFKNEFATIAINAAAEFNLVFFNLYSTAYTDAGQDTASVYNIQI